MIDMAKNMELTKERTNIAKGAAICLMFANHLYSFPDRLLNGNYFTPLTPLFDLESSVENFGGICVSMFMFLSGYGMFLGSIRSDRNPWQYSLKKFEIFTSLAGYIFSFSYRTLRLDYTGMFGFVF